MTLSILNVGSAENEALLRNITTAEEESPLICTISTLAQAHIWASMHQPDIVIVDLYRLNDVDQGADFITRFHQNLVCSDIPVLALVDSQDSNRALLAGASEVVTTPLDIHRCRTQLLNVLSASAQRRMLRYRSQWLDEDLNDLPKNGHAQEYETLFRLLRAGEFCDKETSIHVRRVGKISRRIAEALERPESECDIIEMAAAVHDIGKIGIPDSILRKPGPLTQDERRTIETHTRIGFDILKRSRSAYLQCGALMALAHHERFDGMGYPNGVCGEDIPLCARIVAVADVYDALSSRRPYKLGWTPEKVIAYLNQQKSKHFDPECVDALVSRVQVTDVQ